ncbi:MULTISPECIES: VOC family protein [Mycolicibacterium]|uniref:Lactoylglutathione lyase-like lyase n=3 Tax=Mycolicibacterium gilvum TaxID=1804 RepID=E6TKI6_MYCSR|nr:MULTISPECIES: VOC family protein [Mycolicibacterium]ABP43746.1 Glyoxalase/bleomycin resistance protein/dioxygenase [Mycolicibacterium gilvum PYR-GCK]ADU01452.1 lactoylglutathione lyase-like lyase [Mycolicibacterium gilvum Spyr1]MBV5242002.1 VOC family protein [Mycolicibacterium sp. PAM1]MCV7058140.1 VOC family protein [Mycolicibacterium gilvum]STZ46021.1 glyoxalase/bleomycin resistance protein/dioxygenase [Mycolicibacterium gilvum]
MDVSHVGLRVRDLEASLKFYTALGFTEVKRLTVPDQMAQGLLGLAPPIGFEAVYLRNGGVVLQLLTFAGYPARDEPERGMVGAGLTHLSLAVADLVTARDAVTAAGGAVVADPGGGFACMVRDPDGQLIELVAERFRPVT